MRYRIIIGLGLLLVALDQITKQVVNAFIQEYDVIPVTSFFNLVNVRNRGAAFGFLNDPAISWQFWLFLASTLLAVIVILLVAKGAREKDRLLFIGLGCIMGGAIGNLIDRIRFRAVVDFLDVHYAGWHWPAFNVADIAICVGAGLTALLVLQTPGEADSSSGGADKKPASSTPAPGSNPGIEPGMESGTESDNSSRDKEKQ